jgi:hypothetical protein
MANTYTMIRILYGGTYILWGRARDQDISLLLKRMKSRTNLVRKTVAPPSGGSASARFFFLVALPLQSTHLHIAPPLTRTPSRTPRPSPPPLSYDQIAAPHRRRLPPPLPAPPRRLSGTALGVPFNNWEIPT